MLQIYATAFFVTQHIIFFGIRKLVRASLESFTPTPSAPHFSSHGVSSLCLSTLMLIIDT